MIKIEEVYVRKSEDVTITYRLEKEIKEKANLVLEIARKGKKVVFLDIIKIKEMLLKELRRWKSTTFFIFLYNKMLFTNLSLWYIITKTKEGVLWQY